MNKTLELLKKGFESSSTETPEFKEFFKVFKKEFTKELKDNGVTKVVFSKGHFDISGFFTKGRSWYFSLSDVRGSDYLINSGRPVTMLYRTARDFSDYTGGSNCYVNVGPGMVQKMNLESKYL